MSTTVTAATTANRSIRTASIVAGVGLLLMAIVAPFANFGVLGTLIVDGDAAKTASNIMDAENLFRAGVAALLFIAILDVVVAAGLLRLFAPVSTTISAVAAWFRIAYAAVFVVAISELASIPSLLGKDDEAIPAHTEAFDTTWHVGLILFACHLLVIGYLAYRSGYIHKVFGVLLAIAGLGYAIDGFAAVLVPGYTFEVTIFTFVGEAVFIFWLLIRGRRLTLAQPII
jgi:hypothetical protein